MSESLAQLLGVQITNSVETIDEVDVQIREAHNGDDIKAAGDRYFYNDDPATKKHTHQATGM